MASPRQGSNIVRPRRYLKKLFFFSRFSLTKSAAKVSKEDSRRPPSEPPRRARVSRASHAWRARATQDRAKVGGFTALHNLNYTTRANMSHERTEQIRARIVCTPAINAGRAWGSLYADEIRAFCQPSPAGEGGARSAADEEFYMLLPK